MTPGRSRRSATASLREDRRRLPQVATQASSPFADKDRHAGYRYQLSILQAEFSLTQISIDRDGPDLLRGGDPREPRPRPSGQRSTIFGRRVIRTTLVVSRTRVITSGVVPSLHIDYKSSSMKQYHKEARAFAPSSLQQFLDFGIPNGSLISYPLPSEDRL